MYVTFKSIEFVNYKTIKSSSLVLDERGVLLIKGVNNDKTGSNGAGKSTVANGLLWCLYDRTLIGKETEAEIIPKFIPKKEFKKEGSRVIIVVIREDVEYRITRHKKHPKFKNTVVVEKRVSASSNKYENLSKCTDKETNEFIVNVIGADFDSFVHSNVFSFNNIEPFLGRSDKDKKELILPTFFVEQFRAAYKNTVSKIKDVNEILQGLNNDDIAITVELSEKTIQIQNVENDIADYNKKVEEIKKQIKNEELKQKDFVEKKKAAERGLREIQISLKNLSEKSKETEQSILICKEKQNMYNELNTKKLTLESQLSSARLKMEQLKNSSSDSSIIKLTELNEQVKVNSDEYNRLDKEVKRIQTELAGEENLLDNIRLTKHNIINKLEGKKLELNSVNQSIAQCDSIMRQLEQNKEKVLNKYFSEECKSCPHNKITEVLSDIENDINIQSSLKFSEDYKLSEIDSAIKDLENKKNEVEGFDNNSCKKISEIRVDSLGPAENGLLIVTNKLHDLKSVLTEVQNNVENANIVIKEISNIQNEIDGFDSQFVSIVNQIKEFDVDTPQVDFERLNNELKLLKSDIAGQQLNEKEAIKVVCELDYGIKDILNTIKSLTVQTEPPTNMLTQQASLNFAIKNLNSRKNSIEKNKKFKNEQLDILNFWKIGFSSAGVEGFMLDSILNSMNSLVSKYLGYLSNNTISLTLVPDSTLKSGETRNKISEVVENDSGGPTYKSNSSGERRIMDIAVLFSLKYIYEQITKTKYNIVFMDEVFDSLDASTCSLVITLLHSMSDINSIFVVSHSDSIALEFDSFVTATKTRGITEII